MGSRARSPRTMERCARAGGLTRGSTWRGAASARRPNRLVESKPSPRPGFLFLIGDFVIYTSFMRKFIFAVAVLLLALNGYAQTSEPLWSDLMAGNARFAEGRL